MPTLLRLTAFVFTLAWGAATLAWAEADFQKGLAAYKAGDFAAALKEWRPLAEQGLAKAQHNLGVIYYNGRGVPPNYAEALRWYRRAADQGFGLAQYNLGAMYAEGRGVKQDYVQAYMWYSLAGTHGDGKGLSGRDDLEKKMTAADIATAQKLAREWKPTTGTAPNRRQETGGSEPAASGTGFVVSRHGHVLTNHHVIEGCTTVRATTEGRKQPLTVVGTDAGNDLALLKLPSPSPNIARFREGRNIRAGDGVVVVGFPLHGLLASEANVTTGAVSALAGIGDDTRFLQITAPVQPGNSGGPLLDQSGNIVGVVVSKLNAMKIAKLTGDISQNINFAINGAVAKSFLDANSVEFELASSAKKLESSDVGAHAKKFTLLLECFR